VATLAGTEKLSHVEFYDITEQIEHNICDISAFHVPCRTLQDWMQYISSLCSSVYVSVSDLKAPTPLSHPHSLSPSLLPLSPHSSVRRSDEHHHWRTHRSDRVHNILRGGGYVLLPILRTAHDIRGSHRCSALCWLRTLSLAHSPSLLDQSLFLHLLHTDRLCASLYVCLTPF
jgi:hypothetical protein